MEPETSIRSYFAAAQAQRKNLENSPDTTTAQYQENLRAAIASLKECRDMADRISLFSPNETEDDIATVDLQYILIDYFLAELTLKDCVSSRRGVLERARETYERYLGLLENYGMLSIADKTLHERFLDSRNEFALLSSSDPSARRNTKISRLKQEQELKLKLEHLKHVPIPLQDDDTMIREVYLAEIQLCTHHTFHALDMIAQEIKILALMPATPPAEPSTNERDGKTKNADGYSERLDPSHQLNSSKRGPILSKDGKPLQPFTLLDNRQRLRDGVFRPDHSLPTMTIDEYLAEEKRRGGILDGGGSQSGPPAEIDEGNMDHADQETMQAREWDDFKEHNPKGSGNTLNRG
ncbi:MAG: hypothetical protein Q9195_007059 [Heterodermia aff. obscurata]